MLRIYFEDQVDVCGEEIEWEFGFCRWTRWLMIQRFLVVHNDASLPFAHLPSLSRAVLYS